MKQQTNKQYVKLISKDKEQITLILPIKSENDQWQLTTYVKSNKQQQVTNSILKNQNIINFPNNIQNNNESKIYQIHQPQKQQKNTQIKPIYQQRQEKQQIQQDQQIDKDKIQMISNSIKQLQKRIFYVKMKYGGLTQNQQRKKEELIVQNKCSNSLQIIENKGNQLIGQKHQIFVQQIYPLAQCVEKTSSIIYNDKQQYNIEQISEEDDGKNNQNKLTNKKQNDQQYLNYDNQQRQNEEYRPFENYQNHKTQKTKSVLFHSLMSSVQHNQSINNLQFEELQGVHQKDNHQQINESIESQQREQKQYKQVPTINIKMQRQDLSKLRKITQGYERQSNNFGSRDYYSIFDTVPVDKALIVELQVKKILVNKNRLNF